LGLGVGVGLGLGLGWGLGLGLGLGGRRAPAEEQLEPLLLRLRQPLRLGQLGGHVHVDAW
jgi:hypothetical protein